MSKILTSNKKFLYDTNKSPSIKVIVKVKTKQPLEF